MKNTILLKGALALTIITTGLLHAGATTQLIVNKAIDLGTAPAVKVVCDAYGKQGVQVAKGMNSTVTGLKDTAKKVCCRFSGFRKDHPNVTRDVFDGCKGIEIDNAPSEEDACAFVAIGGSLLTNLPKAVKSTLGDRCCIYEDVMSENPKAAKSLGCEI